MQAVAGAVPQAAGHGRAEPHGGGGSASPTRTRKGPSPHRPAARLPHPPRVRTAGSVVSTTSTTDWRAPHLEAGARRTPHRGLRRGRPARSCVGCTTRRVRRPRRDRPYSRRRLGIASRVSAMPSCASPIAASARSAGRDAGRSARGWSARRAAASAASSVFSASVNCARAPRRGGAARSHSPHFRCSRGRLPAMHRVADIHQPLDHAPVDPNARLASASADRAVRLTRRRPCAFDRRGADGRASSAAAARLVAGDQRASRSMAARRRVIGRRK